MFIYMIPFYYIVSKLAEEKQNKSREGMRMMGLSDAIYYLSWFILYLVIMISMAIIMTVLSKPWLFPQSGTLEFFMINLAYGLSLFGQSIIIVAILPTVRSSATLATLFHIITYFIIFPMNSGAPSHGVRMFASLLPNLAMP